MWNKVAGTARRCDQVSWSGLATEVLERYTKEVVRAMKHDGWDGRLLADKNVTTIEEQWSFAGSMLFSITVITTIGQHVALFSALTKLFTESELSGCIGHPSGGRFAYIAIVDVRPPAVQPGVTL